LVLKKRKGFAKIALETGSSLLPIIGFGENNLFSLVKSKYVEPLHSIAKALFRCQFPVITSQGFLGILPTKTPLVTVGKKLLN
jgi:2-acylglycerol O-acyltransferase 2